MGFISSIPLRIIRVPIVIYTYNELLLFGDDMDLPRLKCLRCGYEWIPRKDKLPKTCTNCNSQYWNTPRKIKHAGVYEPTTKVCKDCKQELPLSEFKLVSSRPGGKGTKQYWVPNSVCMKCKKARYQEWYKTHPQADRLRKFRRDHATCDYTKSGFYLGVVVAEKVLSTMFEHVERMPNNTPGYDFICGKGFKIDCKSTCKRKQAKCRNSYYYSFKIKSNKEADYFLCLAFDNRESLNPEHVWLIPGKEVNHHATIAITDNPKALKKWERYERPLEKVANCCDQLKGNP